MGSLAGEVRIHVDGSLDPVSSRALADAVNAAAIGGHRVVVDIEDTEGFTSDVVRRLADCARRGALLRFGCERTPAHQRRRN